MRDEKFSFIVKGIKTMSINDHRPKDLEDGHSSMVSNMRKGHLLKMKVGRGIKYLRKGNIFILPR